TLTTLDLSWNVIGVDGAKRFADALQHNKVIRSLSSTMAYIFPYFFAQTLTTLHLRDTGLGDEGAAFIANALTQNTVIPILS
ncbi:unnamed protein product, partial [Rotaria magnacalcarata]